MKPPERIRLRLLGRLAIAYGDGGPPIRLSTRKAGALIAYLAMSPEQTASREELATLLWGASTDQQARQSLRQALVLLRKELGWSHFMAADAAVVRLQPGLWSIDAADFDRLSRSSEPEELARAAELFGGEFLTGLNIDEEGFDEWVAAQRQRVQLAAARLCESFAARPELVTDPQQALGAVERLVALDPLREDWQRLALTLYARYRGRNEALAQAEVFAETLRRELGVAPEKATRALIEKIRASEAALEHAPIEMIVPAAAGNAASAPLPPEAIERVTDAVGVPPNPVAAPPVLRPIRLPRPAAAVVAFAGAILLAAIALTIPQLRDSREEAAQRSSSRAAAIERWRSPGALPGPSEQPRAAIAVLPFVAQGNAALQPSADAMTDDLINVLARVPAIRVISRATMESYRDRPIDVAAVAAELDVSYVLEGVVRAAGDKLRVNVELIDPATRSPAWGARIERASDEEGKVRDEIVAQLARELQLGTPAVEAAQAPADPTLRQLYQQGWAAIHASGRSPETLQQAMLAFSRALAQSGQSRWAKIGLANTHALAAAMAIDADRPGHLAKAEELLAPLIAENANSAGPYFAMGLVHEMRGRPLEAIDAYKRVVASNPSHAPSYAGMGHALILAGKAAEGLGYIQYAQRLSPRDAQRAHWLRFAGEGELELGHVDKALDLLRQSQELAPRQVQTLRSLAVALAVAGRIDEAQRVVAEMRGINPGLSDERLLRMARTYDKTRPEFLRGTQLLVAPAALVAGEASSPADQAAKTGPAKQNSGVATILILPFGESGEDNENSRLSADIMTDDLTNAVSRVGGFRVISRQTAATYRGKRVDPKAVGAELGVQYVIEGRVEARGEVLRASVELIDAKSGLRAWSGNYERGGDALPVVIDEVVRSVGRELQVEVNRIASSRDSGDPDVHTLIYKGFSVLGAGWRDADALAQAEKYFTEARARDPNSTRAMTGLGAYHVAMALKLPRA
ncbi:MAG: hypothetical protein JO000_09735, partial [Alphaproteobacteria bacterium]|nr:hypothetical protein [Alphaproteobacteria bacterium]